MTSLRALIFAAAGLSVAGCGNGTQGPADMAMSPDMTPLALCGGDDCMTTSNIKHVVVIIQENHTFDSYFGAYCTQAPGGRRGFHVPPFRLRRDGSGDQATAHRKGLVSYSYLSSSMPICGSLRQIRRHRHAQ